MRVAVVDIGTNSTRLLVADVEDGRCVERERRTIVTRLGEGVDRSGRLGEEPMGRVFAALDEYRAAIEALEVERTVAVLTSAVRDAANGEDFRRTVHDRYKLDAHTIPGAEEARLTFLGATAERDSGDGAPLVVVDLGGGSTELVVGSRGEVEFSVSTQAGVVRHSERFLASDPPARAELEALAAEVQGIFVAQVPGDVRERTRGMVAVAGTATSLAAIDQSLEPYDPDRVHGHFLPRGRVEELRDRLAAMTEAERRHVAGLDPARAPTIVAGAAILLEALRAFGLDGFEVSEHDILHGAALSAGAP
jgi:exopolyphosphatase/guanosine-5'-triphosphate,3'-diphosphate pyrophosphatase